MDKKRQGRFQPCPAQMFAVISYSPSGPVSFILLDSTAAGKNEA